MPKRAITRIASGSTALAEFFLAVFLLNFFLFHNIARFHRNDFLTGYAPQLIIMFSKLAVLAHTVKLGFSRVAVLSQNRHFVAGTGISPCSVDAMPA